MSIVWKQFSTSVFSKILPLCRPITFVNDDIMAWQWKKLRVIWPLRSSWFTLLVRKWNICEEKQKRWSCRKNAEVVFGPGDVWWRRSLWYQTLETAISVLRLPNNKGWPIIFFFFFFDQLGHKNQKDSMDRILWILPLIPVDRILKMLCHSIFELCERLGESKDNDGWVGRQFDARDPGKM